MKWTLLVVTATVGILAATASQASPLCSRVTGIPIQCMYEDPSQCERESARQGGECALNPAEPPTIVSSALYCVVDSTLVASCVYPDRSSCNADATRRKGACVANLDSPYPQADPFRDKRPY